MQLDALAPDDVAPFAQQLLDGSEEPLALARGLVLCAANQAYADLFGYAGPEHMIGLQVLDLVVPEARPMITEFARRRRMGEPVPESYVTRVRRGDGTEIDIRMRSSAFTIGGENFILAMHRPVTASRPDEGRDDSFYRALFEDNPAIKLLISPTSGRILDASRAATEFYGWSLDELKAMTITDINTLTQEQVRAEMESAQAGRRRYFRFRHRLKDGRVRAVEVHSGPVELEGEQLLLSIIHDVTDRDALEQQLQAAQRLESVGKLAGMVAHDFNNLLTVILGSSEMILRQAEPNSAIERLSRDLSSATGRAVALSRDLLAFSRRQLMRMEAVDLNGSVSAITSVLQRLMGEELSLETDLDDDVPATEMDPHQLEQVLMNLVLNARDAMPDGGTILISTAVVSEGDGAPPGQWVRVQVRDEGQGMDEATRARIFEPYFTTKLDAEGAGLGMSTVHGIVTQSGGHIHVESALERGTTVTLHLPISTRGAREAPPAPAARPQPHATVLVVDDQPPLRIILSRGLKQDGFRVLTAASADQAEALFSEEPVDLVITDVVMPERSGIDLARALLEKKPNLPILLISGDLRGHDVSALPDSVRRLQKPFTIAQLREVLDSMLS